MPQFRPRNYAPPWVPSMCLRQSFHHRQMLSLWATLAMSVLLVGAPRLARGAGIAERLVVLTPGDAVSPPTALAERKHADVVLAVTVDADGHVSKVDVVASGGSDLDEAALMAVRQWTFVPAKRGGTALASRIRVPFHFAPPAPPPHFVEPRGTEPGTPVQRAVGAGERP